MFEFELFGEPLAPGTQRDLTFKVKMIAPPATAKTFTLSARAVAEYDGPGYYTIENSPEVADLFPADLGVSNGITSDPIQIVLPQ